MTDSGIIKAIEEVKATLVSMENDERNYASEYLSKESLAVCMEALDIIKSQQAEIERLNKLVIEKHKENNRLNDYLQYAEAEAVKEFAEKLKSVSQQLPLSALSDRFVTISDINNLLKEREET
ncbi:MAG: hypothetical protein ACI4F5_06375 [Acutalibacteraceae bacterium]